MDQLQMFRVNMHLLIGLLACGGIGLVFLLVFWTVIRAWLFHKRQELSQQQFQRERFDAQGQARPAMARGVCQRCGQVREKVFFLETGERVCEGCLGGATGAGIERPKDGGV